MQPVTRESHTSHIPRRQRRRPYPRFVTFLEWQQMLALLSRIRVRPKLSLHSVFSAIQRVMPHARVEIDVEVGRAMIFRVVAGTTTCADSRLDANASRLVQHICHRVNRSSDVAKYQRTPGATSNPRFCHEGNVIPLYQLLG